VSNVVETEKIGFEDALAEWETSSAALENSMTELFGMLD
jgi:hypothetical protein